MTILPTSGRCRFVVLRHVLGPASTGPSLRHGSEHLDWMFQVGQSLRTWSTAAVLDPSRVTELDAIELPDHRIIYLDKQGEVGEDRGTVHRVADGQLNNPQIDENTFRAELIWERPAGEISTSRPPVQRITIQRITIHRICEESWRLRLERGL